MRSDWRPGASLATLRARAELYSQIRSFFKARGVLEVTTPALGRSVALEPGTEDIGWQEGSGNWWYLQGSPELFLKRLLAAGTGDLYQMGPAFRRGESGRLHNLEFTMLEWYRCDYNEHQLMAEVAELVSSCLGAAPFETLSYRTLLRQVWQQDVLALTKADQTNLARQALGLDQSDILDALYAEALVRYPAPRFFVSGFPPDQAAMAALFEDADGYPVAARFECIVSGVELANGYKELTDVAEQRRRLEQEYRRRLHDGLPVSALDERFLAALEQGLPECAGVALGLDRLLMLQLGASCLDEVLSFSHDRL